MSSWVLSLVSRAVFILFYHLLNPLLMYLSPIVNYLLNPPTNLHEPRSGVAAAILVVHFTLLFFVAITYFRILHTVIFNPGFVPRPPHHPKEIRKTQSSYQRAGTDQPVSDGLHEKFREPWQDQSRGARSSSAYGFLNGTAGARPLPDFEDPGLKTFYEKDVFVCEGDGRPRWCSTCQNWKPDRAHHCREVDRCVRKMDHFCPW